ncbi:MAG TPA: hypothetical protein VOA78_02875 [Candidatus Dormibacteraeota bacterium]|nr:hypothetical protein [Candidatus Dormibacteraeota bacterium]
MTQRKPSTIRAIQITRELLHENADTHHTMHGVINAEREAALEKLIEVAAHVATRTPQRWFLPLS